VLRDVDSGVRFHSQKIWKHRQTGLPDNPTKLSWQRHHFVTIRLHTSSLIDFSKPWFEAVWSGNSARSSAIKPMIYYSKRFTSVI